MSTVVTLPPTMNVNSNAPSPNSLRSYGITQPISTKHPDSFDHQSTKHLEDTLRSYDYFESNEELSHRVQVMTKLNVLVREWIRTVSLEKNVPSDMIDNLGDCVHTFGSYRLGVHSKGGDIDTLLLAPRHIDRSDFFTSFVECLRRQNEVRDLRAIEEAFVPVIKLTFDGIELDMLFARLALTTIPDSLDLKDDKILHNLDARCARSLNGCRVTDEILDLVPDRETFKSTLRAIKLWAKKTGLYSNALGFFGGVTWAMLVARICQLYPNAAAATLVHKFFLVYSHWEWPTPVLLKPVNDCHYGFSVWDPMANASDRYHLMPIVTPAYPQQNSTHNVTQSTQKLIVQEIKRGLEIVNEIMTLKKEWKELFIGTLFFHRYKHFIVLLLSTANANQFVEWSGLVEAKIRILVGILERNSYIDIAHVSSDKYIPNEQVFEQQITENDPKEKSDPSSTNSSGMWVVGLQFKNVNKVQLDLTEEIRSFLNVVYRSATNSNMNRENINLDARYIRRRDLSTVLSKDTLSILTNTPRLSKTFSFDDKLPIKRTQQASDSDGMSDSTSKRAKLEDMNEPSPPTSQIDSTSL